MPVISREEANLNRALALLGDVKRYDRVFLEDPAALEVLKGEKEVSLSPERMAKNPLYANRDAKSKHADDERQDPDARFNSNQLSKLSSGIVEYSTAAVMLAGTRVDVKTGKEKPGLDEELSVAVLVLGAMGRETRGGKGAALPSLLDEDKLLVDDTYVKTEFGERTLAHVKGIQSGLKQFNETGGDLSGVPTEYASAVVSLQAARVREAAKNVSLDLISDLPNEVREAFIKENKLVSENPAKEMLDREYAKLEKAVGTGTIAPEVATPVQQILLPAVEAYQVSPETGKLLLWGKPEENRGTAYGQFNIALPANQYKTDEDALSSLDTYKALLLITRYHQDALRKDGTSILSHVLDTEGFGSRTLDDNLRTRVSLVLLLHDLVEDGGKEVANKNADLKLIEKMFGPRTAISIAEMTDDISKNVYVLRAMAALTATPGQHNFAETLKDVIKERNLMPGASEEAIETRAGDILKGSAFTLTTSGPKLADVASTIQKNLEEPQENAGYWRGSGARIGWIVDSEKKGYVARELYASIALGVTAFMQNPMKEKFDQTLSSGHNAGELNVGLLNVLAAGKEALDKYTVQNLTILVDEFKFESPEQKEQVRKDLIGKFADKNVSQQEFTKFLDETLTQERLIANPMDSSTLYKKGSTPENPERSYDNLLKLRDQYAQREVYRRGLEVYADLSVNRDIAGQIRATTKAPDLESKPYIDVVIHYDRQMGLERRVEPDSLVQISRDTQMALPPAEKDRNVAG